MIETELNGKRLKIIGTGRKETCKLSVFGTLNWSMLRCGWNNYIIEH